MYTHRKCKYIESNNYLVSEICDRERVKTNKSIYSIYSHYFEEGNTKASEFEVSPLFESICFSALSSASGLIFSDEIDGVRLKLELVKLAVGEL